MGYINKVINQPLYKCRYPEDVKRIMRVAFDNGIVLNAQQAEAVWDAYSDEMDAGWIILPKKNSEIWEIIGD